MSQDTVEGTVQSAELVHVEPGGTVLAPLDLGDVSREMDRYQEGIKQLLDPSDYQTTGERDEDGRAKQFVKKSGWRKVATWFGLSVEIESTNVHYDEQGNPQRVSVVCRAIAPNGRVMEGDGHCASSEFRGRRANDPKSLNNMIGTATTRAKNRAIADLVGMGEVSAEEMSAANGGAVTTIEPAGVRATEDLEATTHKALAWVFEGLPNAEGKLSAFLEELREHTGTDYLPRSAAQALVVLAKGLRDAQETDPTTPQEDENDGNSSGEGHDDPEQPDDAEAESGGGADEGQAAD